MVRALRSYSTSGGSVRSHPKERALKEGHEIRLRSGSAGHRPIKQRTEEEDEDGGEPIQVILIALRPIHLYLIFEKSSWKNQV